MATGSMQSAEAPHADLLSFIGIAVLQPFLQSCQRLAAARCKGDSAFTCTESMLQRCCAAARGGMRHGMAPLPLGRTTRNARENVCDVLAAAMVGLVRCLWLAASHKFGSEGTMASEA